jgi:hypothetical protein
VSYEQGFEALKNGDFRRAVPLLEKAARETGYASDLINHAYTLALYHRGDKERLAEVSFLVGTSLAPQDPASAMDYFQRAMFGGLQRDGVRRIGEIFEQWAVARVDTSLEVPVTRVAHVVSCLLPGHPLTQYLKILVSSLTKQGIQSTIFTTESAASWFFNPAGVPQSHFVDLEADVKIASVDGDFLQRAESIAEAIRSSGIQVAFFHAGLNEQITARVAAMRPARVQINVNHDAEMDADVFDGRIHLFQHAVERTRFVKEPSDWVPLASDIEARIQMSEPLTRQAMGLESATTISATFGDLRSVTGSGYLKALSEIMKRFPKHFHLFAGAGNVRVVRSHLHAEGVLPRVRFLGQVSDVATLLGVIDVYLAAFPHSGGPAILEAMGAAKPVVVLRFPPDSPNNSGAELVGIRELTAPGEANYIEIVDRLLRNPALREQQGQAVRDRFRAEFRSERLGERYKAFVARFHSR